LERKKGGTGGTTTQADVEVEVEVEVVEAEAEAEGGLRIGGGYTVAGAGADLLSAAAAEEAEAEAEAEAEGGAVMNGAERRNTYIKLCSVWKRWPVWSLGVKPAKYQWGKAHTRPSTSRPTAVCAISAQ
jgi:hypothetical protein